MFMNDRKLEGSWIEKHFPGREKQDVFPAAPRDGFTAAREMVFDPTSVLKKAIPARRAARERAAPTPRPVARCRQAHGAAIFAAAAAACGNSLPRP